MSWKYIRSMFAVVLIERLKCRHIDRIICRSFRLTQNAYFTVRLIHERNLLVLPGGQAYFPVSTFGFSESEKSKRSLKCAHDWK